MTRGDISIRRIKDENSDGFPEILKVDIETGALEVDLSHVENVQHRQTIENLIRDCSPQKTREVEIGMSIILQDDRPVPVYERPRRLSPQDNAEVDKQIETWLKDGIMRQSHSHYAGPIVLVKIGRLDQNL